MEMVAGLDEETVDFVPNYDGSETQPDVLPAGIPNLLVNGTAGIAVGMATNMAPHNLTEVITAARHLLRHPDATLDQLMRFVPGPDLPTGGQIVGLDGIREAYETGRGIFRTRATTKIEQLSPRKTGIVVTELPYGVGPEKVITRIKDLVQARKITGISDLKDLTDRNRGLYVVIEVRSGFNPEAVLNELYRLTPMEDTFGINNVALVDGQPRILGLKELLTIYVEHRLDVTKRRSEFRRRKREERLHLVDGILIALLNIDEVIQVIRTSDDAAEAKRRLIEIFDLSEVQAQYILDTPLRRLTRYDKLELEREQETLRAEIAELTEILEIRRPLSDLVGGEMADAGEEVRHPAPHGADRGRRGGNRRRPAGSGRRPVPSWCCPRPACWPASLWPPPLIPNEPVRLPRRNPVAPRTGTSSPRGGLATTARGHDRRGHLGGPDDPGQRHRDPGAAAGRGGPLAVRRPPRRRVRAGLDDGETVIALASLDGEEASGVALGTASGVVKRVRPSTRPTATSSS